MYLLVTDAETSNDYGIDDVEYSEDGEYWALLNVNLLDDDDMYTVSHPPCIETTLTVKTVATNARVVIRGNC